MAPSVCVWVCMRRSVYISFVRKINPKPSRVWFSLTSFPILFSIGLSDRTKGKDEVNETDRIPYYTSSGPKWGNELYREELFWIVVETQSPFSPRSVLIPPSFSCHQLNILFMTYFVYKLNFIFKALKKLLPFKMLSPAWQYMCVYIKSTNSLIKKFNWFPFKHAIKLILYDQTFIPALNPNISKELTICEAGGG